MTMVDAKTVIRNLREKNKALEDKLEAIEKWFASNNTKTRVSMKEWSELCKILEGEG